MSRSATDAIILALLGAALVAIALTGCAGEINLGENARYGRVKWAYVPAIDLRQGPTFIPR